MASTLALNTAFKTSSQKTVPSSETNSICSKVERCFLGCIDSALDSLWCCVGAGFGFMGIVGIVLILIGRFVVDDSRMPLMQGFGFANLAISIVAICIIFACVLQKRFSSES